jgi:competence protein ComEC
VAIAVALAISLPHAGEIRERARSALGHGVPAREAALARGFVLGEDREVDAGTVKDFRRAGLSHLLAVSGQNVALLALLAMPVLALLGLPLRARLLWVLGLIAVYVPLAGAGPSIQRAAIMGALSVFATLGGRRRSRLYALALAAIATLAIDPGAARNVGWQLSFAAVLGIAILAAPLAAAARWRLRLAGPAGRALAEGAAMTVAATVATAPLIAFHFGELSTVTLVANLLAMPAVAPAMWLGMLIAAAGQVPGFPVSVLNVVEAPLLAYVAQVAAWCGRPGWASLEVRLGAAGLAASYAAIVAALIAIRQSAHRRRVERARRRLPAAAGPKSGLSLRFSARRRLGPVFLSPVAVAAALALFLSAGGGPSSTPPSGLRITVLDVGQGDAILFQPAVAAPILIDGGPAGDGLRSLLAERGVRSLAAAIVTHDQADHAGGVAEILGEVPVERLLYGVAGRRLLEESIDAGARTRRIAAGTELRSGRLRLDVVWPPASLEGGSHAGQDPNRLALVIVARWGGFSMLLTADAEAESTPIDPGPIDVLKVSHHGSDDAGLGALLEGSRPRLAVISVGEDNPYGHPTAATLATLADHGVRTMRTDRDGAVVIEVGGGSVEVHGES